MQADGGLDLDLDWGLSGTIIGDYRNGMGHGGVVRALGWWRSELDRDIHNIDQTTKKICFHIQPSYPTSPLRPK